MIRLQFVLAAGPASRLIAWFGAGGFSHVDAVWTHGSLLGARSDRVGGEPSGVYVRPPGYARWLRRTVFEVPASPSEERRWRGFLFDQLAKPYDRRAILAFVCGRNWREDDSWICSELQARALEVAGVCPRLCLPAHKITPGALALVVSAIGGRIIDRAHPVSC